MLIPSSLLFLCPSPSSSLLPPFPLPSSFLFLCPPPSLFLTSSSFSPPLRFVIPGNPAQFWENAGSRPRPLVALRSTPASQIHRFGTVGGVMDMEVQFSADEVGNRSVSVNDIYSLNTPTTMLSPPPPLPVTAQPFAKSSKIQPTW